MKEIWKDIPGYEGLYQVSNMGNVKSLDRVAPNNNNGTQLIKGRVLKPGSNDKGYRQVSLSKDGRVRSKKITSLMAMAFFGHKPNGKLDIVVDHKNNINTDDRLDNLQLITNRKNLSKDKKNKTSRYTGVNWYKTRNKWHARITINSKRKHLGYFDDEDEAGAAYQKALNQLDE